MKEMMIRLPMVTAATERELQKAKTYPKSGRYIVQVDNGDVVIADVTLREIKPGEAREYDENVSDICCCCVGQPELLDPDDWVPAADIDELRRETDEMKAAHEEEMDAKERECQSRIDTAMLNVEKAREDYEQRRDGLTAEYEQKYQLRKMELEQDYERRQHQLELDIPKRFGQGEWVSGKTLVEIVKALATEKKEG